MDARYTMTVLSISLMILSCSQRPAPVQTSKAPEPTVPASVSESVDSFQPVKAVLGRTCAPCHNPGGKMYERLPFDQPEVVRTNHEGIIRRLSAEDKLVLEKWLLEGS
jgi:hypothetical protein